MAQKALRIGAGAGYAGDRIPPALALAEKGQLDYLVFECLAERTIALAQLEKIQNPMRGFDPLLSARMKAVLPACMAQGTRIITNMGAANPLQAGKEVLAVAKALGLHQVKVAVVLGDDVLPILLANYLSVGAAFGFGNVQAACGHRCIACALQRIWTRAHRLDWGPSSILF